jgi:hypothetical protein
LNTTRHNLVFDGSKNLDVSKDCVVKHNINYTRHRVSPAKQSHGLPMDGIGRQFEMEEGIPEREIISRLKRKGIGGSTKSSGGENTSARAQDREEKSMKDLLARL